MQLTKISRSKSFEMVNGYGLKKWDKMGLEGELTENENPLDAYNELGKIIDQSFKDSYPNTQIVHESNDEVVAVSTVNATIQGMIDDLNKCTEVYEKNGLGVQTGLVAYEDAAAKFPEIKAAYDLKMLQLTKNN